MHSFESRSRRMSTLVLLGCCALLGTQPGDAAAQDRQIVNEHGGIGVHQSGLQITGTSQGALVLFYDDRSGRLDYRIRSVDASGKPDPDSVNVEQLLEPDTGFSSPKLTSNTNAGASILSWRTWTTQVGYSYKVVALDQVTGEPISDPVVVERFDNLFVSDAGGVLFLRSIDATVVGRFYDSDFNPIGTPMILADDSDLDFPPSIYYYDAAFAPDDSFVFTWTGMSPPYFEQIKSQQFNADGTPAGGINEHTPGSEQFGLVSLVHVQPDGTSIVTWTDDDSYMGQTLDAYGATSGDPVVLHDAYSEFETPQSLATTIDGDWLAVSDNGMATYDQETLAMLHSQAWTSSAAITEVVWMPAQYAALTAWKNLDAPDGDHDIMGSRHSLQGGSTEAADLSDDVDGAYQIYPSAAFNSNGRSLIAWLDKRFSSNGTIAFQMYDENGEKDGVNRFLATPSRTVYSPQVSMNDTGASVISWIEVNDQDPNGLKSLKVQRFDASNQLLGSAINIYTESYTLLAPIFGGIWDTHSNKRELLLLDNGSFFATWGLKIVTGGTIGNPTYGRTDLFTKAYNANNSSFSASANQKLAGFVHGLVPSGTYSAQVLYYNTSSENLRMLEFSATGSASSETVFPDLPDFGVAFDTNFHMDVAYDQGTLSIAFSGDDNRAYTAHYSADGQLLASDALEQESTFACLQIAPDGGRVLLHGTSSELHCKQYDAQGMPLGDSFLVSEDEAFSVSYYGIPEFEMLLVDDMIRLTRHIESGTDQAEDIELSSYDFDPDSCSPADFNCDGSVNGFDLAHLLGYWGLTEGDLNGDGTTNGADLAFLLGAWTG